MQRLTLHLRAGVIQRGPFGVWCVERMVCRMVEWIVCRIGDASHG